MNYEDDVEDRAGFDEIDDIDDERVGDRYRSGHAVAENRFAGIFNRFNNYANNPNFGDLFEVDGMGYGGHPSMRPPATAFSKGYRAFSTAILEIKQGRGERTGGRSNVMHGGKIIMPQDALVQLTQMDMESPYMFEIRNSSPTKPELFTHCGVLEFIADPGTVHLPQWMMKRLDLNEGDPIKLTGTRLPKGKFAKVQAQSTLFLELGDHKAVLETALRNFSCLTKGDIIEIYHNMMTFEILIMELKPADVLGVSIFETDLEVEFAAPLGYVEPERLPRAPPPTLASKLNIDASGTQSVNARGSGTSTPAGSTNAAGPLSWEAFTGGGRTMGGKSVKGKGISKKKIEEVDVNSKIFRTGIQKVITPDTQIGDRQVPARLELPFGTLFFGYNVQSYRPTDTNGTEVAHPAPFASLNHIGNTLSGRTRTVSEEACADENPESSNAPSTTPFSGDGHSLTKPAMKSANRNVIVVDDD